MKEPIEARLSSLKAEFKAGQTILAELETREADVRNTLVRISGAIQVLEELLREEDGARPRQAPAAPQDQLTATA